jgi:hypothetical protein
VSEKVKKKNERKSFLKATALKEPGAGMERIE